MCLAIYCPAGLAVPQDVIECGILNNPDGAGFAVQTGAGLRIRKFGPDVAPGRFLASWNSVRAASPGGNAILHFRYATAGSVDRAMAHPFRLGRWAIAHNGHISGLKEKQGESDTAAFVRIVAPAILHSGSNFCATLAKHSLEVSAGRGNRVLALPICGPAIIAGESLGFWGDGVWYSNYSGHWLDTPQESSKLASSDFDEWGYPTAEALRNYYDGANSWLRTTEEK